MITFLAAAGVVIWLVGVVILVAGVSGAMRRTPLPGIPAGTNPAGVAAVLALITVAWPAIPIAAILVRISGRKVQ